MINKKIKKKKLIIIGIDGGTFDIINPFISKGLLPNLEKFKHKEILKSTTPPGTGVAWASFSTGNFPGKTNIFDFTIVPDNSWDIKVVNKNILKTKTLWTYLTENNKKSIIINIPITYPPEKVNGVMISGIDAPSLLSNYTYPPNIKNKLKEFNYEIEVSGLKEKLSLPQEAVRLLNSKIKTASYFLNKNFDFYIMLFRESDVAQHFAWGKKEVEIIYREIDKFIGEVIRKAKKINADLIIMSDHGHEKVEKAFNVNSWLEKNNYLSLKQKKRNLLGEIGINREKIFKILETFNLQFLVKIIPRKLGKKIPTSQVDFEEAIITKRIDLTRTKAIAKRAVKTAQIFLNTEERGGIVKKSEVPKLKKKIKQELNLFLKRNNIEAIIKTKEELYGKNVSYAPDITIYMKEKGYDIQTRFTPKKPIWDQTKEQATHAIEGIILTDMNLNFKDPRIIDLAPTVLDYFNIKGGKFDGKSLL